MSLSSFREGMRLHAIHLLGGVAPQRGLTDSELVELIYPTISDEAHKTIVEEMGEADLADPQPFAGCWVHWSIS